MPPRIYVPTDDPEEWIRLLAGKDADWKTGYSAKTLAYCWHMASDFPQSVRRAFAVSPTEVFGEVRLLLAIPEHGVSLPGGGRQSKNDLFVLGRAGARLMAMMVEGKVKEPFDRSVECWLRDGTEPGTGKPSAGKTRRLRFLCGQLGIPESGVGHIAYQLLHRTVSALLEARRFAAPIAVMLVHSFSPTHDHFTSYADFAALFGVSAKRDCFQFAGSFDGIDLYLGWVTGESEFLKR